MSEYQAVYDAVRSRLGNIDVGDAIERAVREADIGYRVAVAAQEISARACDVADEHRRPSVLYRPSLFMDGDAWCALYGENIQVGVCGFGESPAKAMAAFDAAWATALAPAHGGV